MPVRNEELPLLAAHVREEYERVRLSTTAALELYATEGHRALLRDLYVTSLNVHARNLLAFFACSPHAHPEDVLATDYTETWDPGQHGGIDLIYLQSEFAPSVNKRLAHISARRVRSSNAEDAVPVAEIYMAIAGMMERFLTLLNSERRAWFSRDGAPPDTSTSPLQPLRTS